MKYLDRAKKSFLLITIVLTAIAIGTFISIIFGQRNVLSVCSYISSVTFILALIIACIQKFLNRKVKDAKIDTSREVGRTEENSLPTK